jgi:prepilin-type N-terminal cleavage/methylation domain-containing protein
MRRAFTAIEVLIVLMIIVIFILLAVNDKPDPSKIEQWDEVQVKETGVRGRVMSDNNRSIVKLRIDNGPGAAPRYSEVSFSRDEVTKLAEKKP